MITFELPWVSWTDPRGGTKLLRRSIKYLYLIEASSNEILSMALLKDQEVEELNQGIPLEMSHNLKVKSRCPRLG